MGRLLAVGLVVIAALIAVLVVNGEGPNKPEEADAAAPAAQSTTVSTAPAKPDQTAAGVPVTAIVHMKRLRFSPPQVSIDLGQAVRFVNDDNVAHTVLQDFGPRSGEVAAVDSDRILPGETFEFVPRAVGLVSYVCTLHPSVMHGQILVEKHAD